MYFERSEFLNRISIISFSTSSSDFSLIVISSNPAPVQERGRESIQSFFVDVKKRIFMKSLILLFVFLLFFGCSPEITESEPFILDKKTLWFSEDRTGLRGTGRILFNQPLLSLYSKELYFITARLFNENSFLILHSHFTGFVRKDGVKIFFIRDKNNLVIQISTPFYPPQHLLTDENYFIKNQNLELRIQVQNGVENFIRVTIWDHYINTSGYLKKITPFLLRQNLMADSDSLAFYSKGQGLLWGVDLNKASVIKIYRESVNQ